MPDDFEEGRSLFLLKIDKEMSEKKLDFNTALYKIYFEMLKGRSHNEIKGLRRT